MKKVLWISNSVPYDKAPHAGGQIHNYYIKELAKHEDIDIKLLTFAGKDELSKIDLDSTRIAYDLIVNHENGFKHVLRGLYNKIHYFKAKNHYAFRTSPFQEINVLHYLSMYKKNGYDPKIIILQWTQMVLLLPEIKKIYPASTYICIEEDVAFLGYERKYKTETNAKEKSKKKKLYDRLKTFELDCLNQSSCIILNNYKDRDLLVKNKVEENKLYVWAPFFHNMSKINRHDINKDILFYGAMNREENWKSAIWFIENVFEEIDDETVRFVVVGNKPPQELKKYESDRIRILGFQESVVSFFESSMCLVAPLVLGAGVKIKIIEGISSGIPVLTNLIGIEGIPAKDTQDFFFCESPDDYKRVICMILNGQINMEVIEENCRRLIKGTYNLEEDANRFYSIVANI